MSKSKNQPKKSLSTFLGAKDTKDLIQASVAQFQKGGVGGYRPLCMWGEAGTGKTSFVNQVADNLKKNGLRVKIISFQLSAMQPFDLGGYPFNSVETHNNKQLHVQRFGTPYWMVHDKEYDVVILFLDEINRARVEMHNSIMGVLDGRGVNGHPVPPNCFVIAAGNPVTDDGNYGAVTEICDEAILDRMIHINVATEKSETLAYMFNDDNGVHRTVYNFLNEDRTRIPEKHFDSITKGLKSKDRSYTHLGQILPYVIDNLELRDSVCKGLLGDTEGQLFSDKLHAYSSIMDPEDVLNTFNAEKKKIIIEMVQPDKKGETRLDSVGALNDSIILWLSNESRKSLNKKQMKNLKAYLDIIPHDMKENLLSKSNFNNKENQELTGEILDTMSKETVDLRKLKFR